MALWESSEEKNAKVFFIISSEEQSCSEDLVTDS